MYARVVHYVGDRKTLSEERLEGLEEVVMDSTKTQAILEAARMSMGEEGRRRGGGGEEGGDLIRCALWRSVNICIHFFRGVFSQNLTD